MVEQWVRPGVDGRPRCWWAVDTDLNYEHYHDSEWGTVVKDGRALFEKLVLEGFQAGLSWLTILRKRENFRAAFDGFDPSIVASYNDLEVERLLDDQGIVRSRAKISAAISNARVVTTQFETLTDFSEHLWSFAPSADRREVDPRREWTFPVPGLTPSSERLARSLKDTGWKFLGPTSAYAFMQSVGMVDDHVPGCWRAP